MVANIQVVVSWVVTSCGLVGSYQVFGGIYTSLHLQHRKPVGSSRWRSTIYDIACCHKTQAHILNKLENIHTTLIFPTLSVPFV